MMMKPMFNLDKIKMIKNIIINIKIHDEDEKIYLRQIQIDYSTTYHSDEIITGSSCCHD